MSHFIGHFGVSPIFEKTNKYLYVKWTLPCWRVHGAKCAKYVQHGASSPAARGLLLAFGVLFSSWLIAKTKRWEDKDKAADILAREAVGYWAARQAQDVAWPSASLCGVGAALDYTVTWGKRGMEDAAWCNQLKVESPGWIKLKLLNPQFRHVWTE